MNDALRDAIYAEWLREQREATRWAQYHRAVNRCFGVVAVPSAIVVATLMVNDFRAFTAEAFLQVILWSAVVSVVGVFGTGAVAYVILGIVENREDIVDWLKGG